VKDCNEPTSGFLDFSKFYSQSFWLCCNFFQPPVKHSCHKLLGKTYKPFGPWILWVSVTFVISFQGWFRSNDSLSSTLFGVFNNGCYSGRNAVTGCYSWRNAETHFQGPVTERILKSCMQKPLGFFLGVLFCFVFMAVMSDCQHEWPYFPNLSSYILHYICLKLLWVQ
jgi:hypothetical protein